MALRRPGLLDEIERDLERDAPIAKTLRKIVLLGGRVGSAELREWAGRELRGYLPDDELPSYRVLHPLLQADFISRSAMVEHQTVSPEEFPEWARDRLREPLRLMKGIGEIERMGETATGAMIKLSPVGASELMLLVNKAVGHINKVTAIYWSVSVVEIEGIVDQVRTRLVELAAELRAATPRGQEAPTADAANRAVTIVAKGRSTVNYLASGDNGSNSVVLSESAAPDAPPAWHIAKGVWALLLGTATVAAAIFGWVALSRDDWTKWMDQLGL